MMMNSQTVIHYSTTVSKDLRNKITKPDNDGYYSIILGGFNVYNSSGAFYPLDPVKSLFNNSSTLMRRIKNGQLRSELGHPTRKPGEPMAMFIARLPIIDEKNVCAHIKEVSLEYSGTENDPVYVRSKIKPSGPHGKVLKEYLDNPEENVAFSVRSITIDKIVNGTVIKNIKELYTWDYVNEPGIRVANQWTDAGLESSFTTYETETSIITIEELTLAVNDADKLSMESSNSLKHLLHTITLESDLTYLNKW